VNCGSWCTKDIKIGDGCGDNRLRMCGPVQQCQLQLNLSACEAVCDQMGPVQDGVGGCNALNFNASHGCCPRACPKGSALGPPPKDSPGCCGYWRTDATMNANPTVLMRAIDVVTLSRNKGLLWTMPLGAGHIVATGLKVLPAAPTPSASWVLDRLIRYGGSLLK
jgi:hypothetical protein